MQRTRRSSCPGRYLLYCPVCVCEIYSESFKLFKVLKFLGVLDFEITDYFESGSLNFYKDFVTWVVVHLYSVVAILFYLRNSLTQLWLN